MNTQHSPLDSSDKRDVAYIFRERMALLIAQSGNNLSQFSKSIGIDRSALSQFLAPDSTRLPRAETLCAISRACGVSLDWLMGLIANDGNSDDIVPSIEIMRMNEEEATRKIEEWHRDAIGYKIRYVPNTLPDIMRINEVSEFEFKYNHLFIRKAQDQQAKKLLVKTLKPDTDIEVCMPLQTLELFAKGEGVWKELPKEIRKKQLEHMLKLTGEFYPTFRLFFFDQQTAYSAPYTLFGPLRAAVYLGNMYLLVNSVDHIKALTQHFDRLIRLAKVGPDRAEEQIQKFLAELK
ncbi:helix-turn-helix domain-containing protein [Kiloniella antarctica]|uniref:Helix-turn-helix domain-containing protein n=1 Tax=Kiloniella antarctica TaxID=1550907 RepID=A0ABW5BNK7_9PROT